MKTDMNQSLERLLKNPSKKSFQTYKDVMKDHLDSLNDEQLKKFVRSGASQLSNSLIAFYPDLIPSKIKHRRIYLSCFSHLSHYRKTKNQEKLKDYSACLISGFDRGGKMFVPLMEALKSYHK